MSKTNGPVTTINGRFRPRGEDRISVFDNSLLYAEGIFETLLTVDDNIIFLNEHLKRMRRSLKLVGIDPGVTDEKLVSWMERTILLHPARVKQLRLTITSGESARYVGRPGKPQIILSAAPYTHPTEPFKLWVCDYRVDQESEFRRIKTISYVIHAAALTQARKKKCDDALMLNERHLVSEVTSANIYWIDRGRLFTPPLSAGCLDGVTRRIVIREAKKLGINLIERNVSLAKLLQADEILISSSLKLIVPIGAIKSRDGTRRIPVGPVGERLRLHFLRLVGVNQ